MWGDGAVSADKRDFEATLADDPRKRAVLDLFLFPFLATRFTAVFECAV